MMEFETKKALLEYLGKDPNDRKLVDRMIARWDVYMEDGMYYLVDKEDIHVLREENEKLKKKLEENSDLKFISKAMGEKVLDHGEIKRLEDENLDLRRHLMYLWERTDHKNECLDWLVQSFFNKNRQQYDFDTAKEKFYDLIKYNDDPLEKEERQRAVDNWILIW